MERRVQILAEHVSRLESAIGVDPSEWAKYSKEWFEGVQALQERGEDGAASSAAATTPSRVKELEAENERLKAELAKRDYQIKFLLRQLS